MELMRTFGYSEKRMEAHIEKGTSYIKVDSEREEMKDRMKEMESRFDMWFIEHERTRICKLSSKWRHLQIQYSLTGTGRIIHKINPKAVTRERRKLKAYKRLLDKGVMKQEEIDECFRSWLGGNYKNMSKMQIYGIIRLYYKLFERRLTWKRKHGRLRWLTEQALKGLR